MTPRQFYYKMTGVTDMHFKIGNLDFSYIKKIPNDFFNDGIFFLIVE